MLSCTRRLLFCAGHRVYGHENKCAHLHGHNYVVFITARAALDAIGRVVDFAVLKARVGGWLDEAWDHGFLVYERDAAARMALDTFAGLGRQTQKVAVLPVNPTAENLALLIAERARDLLADTYVVVERVVVWETPNCFATWEVACSTTK